MKPFVSPANVIFPAISSCVCAGSPVGDVRESPAALMPPDHPVALLQDVYKRQILGLGAFCGLLLGRWAANVASRQIYGVTAGVMAGPEDATLSAAEALKRPDEKMITRGQAELERYGYTPEIFVRYFTGKTVPAGMLLFCVLAVIWLITRMLQTRSLKRRVEGLTKVLRTVNRGGQAPLAFAIEDDFSRLEDELGKTVNELKRSREEAVEVQKSLAENLADISHQLKTPVSSMTLMAEMLKDEVRGEGDVYKRQSST